MTPSNDNAPLMSPKEASSKTTLSRTLLALMAEAGEFPKPVKIGVRRIAYVRSEVLAWISDRIAARTAA